MEEIVLSGNTENWVSINIYGTFFTDRKEGRKKKEEDKKKGGLQGLQCIYLYT